MTVSYKRSSIAKMTIPNIKSLVRKHNLHTTYIKNYSRLRKAELVSKFMEHYKKSPPTSEPEEPPYSEEPPADSSPSKAPPTPKRASRVTPMGKAKKPNKKARGSSKPKMTQFDKAMGVDKPLYSKEEGGLTEGARAQFEKKYGSAKDAKFLKSLQKEMESEKGRGKRQRKKKIQNPDFVYSEAKKRGRPKKKKA